MSEPDYDPDLGTYLLVLLATNYNINVIMHVFSQILIYYNNNNNNVIPTRQSRTS